MKKVFIVLVLAFLLASQAFAFDFTITIGDANKQRAVNALCSNYNYQETIPDPNDPKGEAKIPNPETKGIFCKRILAAFIKGNIKAYEAMVAMEQARNTAIIDAEKVSVE